MAFRNAIRTRRGPKSGLRASISHASSHAFASELGGQNQTDCVTGGSAPTISLAPRTLMSCISAGLCRNSWLSHYPSQPQLWAGK